ncbi:MAG: transglutaminase domain-containing protein, partial [Chloroflexota bacterium]
QRAEQLFSFVQANVNYISDKDQFDLPEFAQNADEMALMIEREDRAYGDCEDYATLLAVMCQGAGLRSAIVLSVDHAAALIHVPGYSKANRTLSLNGEDGWVWAEATGKNNPLGWTPERYIGAPLAARETEDEGLPRNPPADRPTVTISRNTGTGWTAGISPFLLILLFVWLFTRLRPG